MLPRWLFLILAFAATGCATPLGQFGDQARFSPAFRGYVLAPANGSDDPDIGDDVLVLRDPLTGNKLRCREEVVEWREVHEDLAADLVEDENAAIAVATTTGVVFAPLLAMQPLGGAVFAEAMLVAEYVYDDVASDDAFELLLAGRELYDRTRYRQACSYFERALIKDASVGVLDMAYFYLGMAYAKEKADERARVALSLFVSRAGVRDVDAYRKAEATLAKLGLEPRPCDSIEPVEVYW